MITPAELCLARNILASMPAALRRLAARRSIDTRNARLSHTRLYIRLTAQTAPGIG